MADIPVQPKQSSSLGWLWALLGVLAIAAILFFVFVSGDEEEADDRVVADTTVVDRDPYANRTPDTTPITSLALLDESEADPMVADSAMGTGAMNRYDGRLVDLQNVRVASVVGDSAFFVTDDAGGARRILVALTTPMGASTAGSASAFDVAEGDIVSLRGTVRRYDEAMPRSVPMMARRDLRAGALYIAAAVTDVMDDASMDMTPRSDSTLTPR